MYKVNFRLLILLGYLCFITCRFVRFETKSTLLTVHAIFRHGDRTPVPVNDYPNDPYKNYTYLPYGPGELTNRGKNREYNLGKRLRKRYGTFLRDFYYPTLINARSTAFSRTQMSVLLVLAGLFPPNLFQKWNKEQNWQPIPYNYQSTADDKILANYFSCPKLLFYLNEYVQTEEVQQLHNNYSKIFSYIKEQKGSNSSGIISDFFGAFSLYYTLKTQEEMNLELPEWTQKVYPEPLYKLTCAGYAIITGNTKLRKIGSGPLLEKIVNDSLATIHHESDTKLFLYSGHEYNVATLLSSLDIFKPHAPPYGSCILFEFHNISGQIGVKIFYENYENIQTGLLKLPECEEFCVLDKFIHIVSKYFYNESLCE